MTDGHPRKGSKIHILGSAPPVPPNQKEGFWMVLEQRARDTVRDTKRLWGSDVESFLEREIALTLGELDRARGLQQGLSRSLDRQESYVNADMRYLNRPKYPVFPVHDRRDHLKQKLARIEKERRQLVAVDQQQTQLLHERLLSLWHKHRQLTPAPRYP